MNNIFEENKRTAYFTVNLVSKLYHLDDAVIVKFKDSSFFPNRNVTEMSTKDYRIIHNKNRLKICPSYEVLITIFHEMHHICRRCCVDF